MENVKEYIDFIKQRINESFFREEKIALYKGLKLMNMTLNKYLKLQINQFTEEDFNSETPPEVNVLTLPSNPLSKVLTKMIVSKQDEIVMEEFAAVQMTLGFITFEYFRINGEKKIALDYANYMIRTIDKVKSRFITDIPAYLTNFQNNMLREAKLLETENGELDNTSLSQEDLSRFKESVHYLSRIANNRTEAGATIQKTVHKIHFEDYSGEQFERLIFAYVLRHKTWDSTPEWLGQAGSDAGRDIWAIANSKTYCYACANYKALTFNKTKSDIDKLRKNKYIPTNLIVVCGGIVSANLRTKIVAYGKKAGAETTEVWTGVELEEKLRHEAPELIKRFVEGEVFPDSPGEIIKYNNRIFAETDVEIINLLAECFDRPAFTTPFYLESSIPEFEKAITRTIEVLNTGVHRLNDGTIIRTIASRHKIADEKLKSEWAVITQLVIKLRDTFTDLKRKKEIQPCGCGNEDCPTYTLSENACKIMDSSRQDILTKFMNFKKFEIKI